MSAAHVVERRLQELVRGGSPATAETAHLARCRRCVESLVVLSALWLDPSRAASGSPCLVPAALVRLAEGVGLAPLEVRGARRHVSGCARCAAELEALSRAERAAPSPPRRGAAVRAGGSLLERLRGLLTWSMPLSLAVAARGQGRPMLAAFQRAMVVYRQGRFDAARALLVAAREAGEDAPELDFYLGCCWLQADEASRAEERLAAAVARRSRVGEYRYYLAQALLAAGNERAALGQLERAAALPGPQREQARVALTEARGLSSARKPSLPA